MSMAGSLAVDPMVPRPHYVRGVRQESADTFTMELKATDGSGGGAFAPGQFNMLYAFGVGDAALSISGDPGHTGVVVHTAREVGAVTGALARLGPGDAVGVRGPFGHGWPIAEAAGRDVVLVAGGIGLAPLRSAVYELLAHRERYGRIALAYGVRTPGDILYSSEFETWRDCGRIEVAVSVDRASESWSGHVGVVTALLRQFSFDARETIAMICGPEIMMRHVAGELRARDVASSAIHVALERNMKCAVGLCGHCQLGPAFVCRDGPVFPFDVAEPWLQVSEL